MPTHACSSGSGRCRAPYSAARLRGALQTTTRSDTRSVRTRDSSAALHAVGLRSGEFAAGVGAAPDFASLFGPVGAPRHCALDLAVARRRLKDAWDGRKERREAAPRRAEH